MHQATYDVNMEGNANRGCVGASGQSLQLVYKFKIIPRSKLTLKYIAISGVFTAVVELWALSQVMGPRARCEGPWHHYGPRPTVV